MGNMRQDLKLLLLFISHMLSEGIHTEMRCRIDFKCRTLRWKHMETGSSGRYFVESCQKLLSLEFWGVSLLADINALN